MNLWIKKFNPYIFLMLVLGDKTIKYKNEKIMKLLLLFILSIID